MSTKKRWFCEAGEVWEKVAALIESDVESIEITRESFGYGVQAIFIEDGEKKD